MSSEEHQRAEKSLLDDEIMKQILQDARFIPMAPIQDDDIQPYARLDQPQQLFGRPSVSSKNPGNPDADLIFPGEDLTQRQSQFTPNGDGGVSPPASNEFESSSQAKDPNEHQVSRTSSFTGQGLKRPVPPSPSPAPRKRVVTFTQDGGSAQSHSETHAERPSLFGGYPPLGSARSP